MNEELLPDPRAGDRADTTKTSRKGAYIAIAVVVVVAVLVTTLVLTGHLHLR
jgi:hypothetical protein